MKLSLLVLLAVSFMAAAPAIGKAATLGLVFDNTSSGASTGTPPWDADDAPGNDSTGANQIVRTNDRITYHWGISVNGGNSPNTTLIQTLPEGVTWVGLPAYCLASGTPVSAISNSGRTITCNLGAQTSGSASDYYPIAQVGGKFLNGDTLTTDVTLSSSDPSTSPITSEEITDTISAEPRVDLTKDFIAPVSDGCYFTLPGDTDPTWGQCIKYPMSLVVEAQAGKRTKGNEELAQPLNWVDDLTGSPEAYLKACDDNLINGNIQPLPNFYAPNPPFSIRDSGDITCNQPGGQGGNINVSVSGADLSGQHVPTNAQQGAALPANISFLAEYYLEVFVPFDDIPVSGGLSLDDTLTGFNPSGISPDGGTTPGTPNFGGAGEPTDNNSANAVVNREDPGPGTLGVNKCLSSPNNIGGCSWSDNKTVAAGEVYWATLVASVGGDEQVPRVAICDTIDQTTQRLSLNNAAGGSATQAAWIYTGSPNHIAGTVQYGTGGSGGHTPAEWNQTRTETCDDDESPAGWFSDPTAVPGGIGAITKIRAIASGPTIPGDDGKSMNLVVRMEARGNDPTDNSILPTGTVVADFMNATLDFDTTAGEGDWFTNGYNPTTGGGEEGDRVVLARSQVRIRKNTEPAGKTTASTGEVVKFRLQPTVSGQSEVATVVNDVTVTDTLPANMTYQEGSASIPPASVAPGPGGTTVITWNLGDRVEGEAVPPITFDARVNLDVPNGGSVINRTTIASPDDPSLSNERTSSWTLTVNRIAGIIIVKSTSTPWVEPHDDLAFTVEYANNSVNDLAFMDSIDVLPYNGDSRGTSFTGTAQLASVNVSDGEDVYYTSAAPATVSNNPNAASNNMPGGTTKWCLPADFGTSGCPADIAASTGVRVINGDTVMQGEVNSYEMVIHTDDNGSGDRYVNDAGLSGDGVSLPAFSQPVADEVVSSSLGDYLWNDLNRNGIQDNGEPGVDDLEVTLTGTDKNGDSVSRTTTTAGGGLYRFDDLISGDYEITFTKPTGYSFTIEGAGNNPALDSNAKPAGGTGTITIESPVPLREDQEDLDWDAGIIADEGQITIVKDAKPDADIDFDFSSTGGLQPAAFVLNDDGKGTENTRTFTVPGDGSEYEFTEAATADWKLTGIVCTGTAQSDTEVSSARARVQVGPGETATCVYTNEKVEKPVVKKPNVAIRKTGDRKKVLPGGVIAYKIGFRNTVKGTVAKNVVICDNLPAHTSVVGKGGGYFKNGNICWTIKKLGFSQQFKTRSLRLKVDRDARPGTRIKNVVTFGKAKDSWTTVVKRPPGGGNAAKGGGVTG